MVEVWSDLVIPAASAIATTGVAVVAVVIARQANKTAEAAHAFQMRLASEAIEREEVHRRREVGAAVRSWFEYAMISAMNGRGWMDEPGVTLSFRSDQLTREFGDKRFEMFVSSLALHPAAILTKAASKGEGYDAKADGALYRLGLSQIEQWVSDPDAFAEDPLVALRIDTMMKEAERVRNGHGPSPREEQHQS
ncbi:hypothetical protein [Agromyces mediolanus]|jgi:hypothetical protein|uniref:hypothetical protein n=1 Tax=Agromyces mediolanus TaxID=41986 RepID=UPI001E2A61A0|nr:hypothetical protein [Agromyces mediolanus]MCD1572269.1 hypothetical protein [Agromyces mediolanus]